MREILFRGKSRENGEWVEGCLICVNEYCCILQDEEAAEPDEYPYLGVKTGCIDGFATPVIPETVGQFTGLTDKNGKKIFEGDILQFDYTGKNLGVKGLETVIFENGQFGVKWGWHKEFVSLVGFANTTLTVIGNIHDNPELLKEGAENE